MFYKEIMEKLWEVIKLIITKNVVTNYSFLLNDKNPLHNFYLVKQILPA